jgi:hypothetical protein
MPKARPKPVQAVIPPTPPPPKPTPTPPVPSVPALPVIHKEVKLTEYSTTSAAGPLKIAALKQIVGWQTEKEFQEFNVSKLGGKPEHYLFGEVYHCKNVKGEKVRLNYNAHNRPFDEGWCQSLIHTHLYGQWAGPHTIPGETVNGETVRISRYGRVLSGQHSITAAILANEFLHKAREEGSDPPDDPKYPAWRSQGEVFLETIVVTGLSEDPRVLMTVDYVKPRTASDVFYTSDVFKSCTAPERKELCKLLSVGVDVLWSRTDTQGYKTHPEVVAFLERHHALLKCVEHLFTENRTAAARPINRLRLNPGTCAGLMYIMGSSGPKTDGDVYRNEKPPSEKNLDWYYQDKAEEFWTLLASGVDFLPVRTALNRLRDSSVGDDANQGMGGAAPEKLALLAKAWELWKDHPNAAGPPFNVDDMAPGGVLCLSYSDLDDKGNKLADGEIKLLDVADFEGIDWPNLSSGAGSGKAGGAPMPPISEAELEKAKEAARLRRQQGVK